MGSGLCEVGLRTGRPQQLPSTEQWLWLFSADVAPCCARTSFMATTKKGDRWRRETPRDGIKLAISECLTIISMSAQTLINPDGGSTTETHFKPSGSEGEREGCPVSRRAGRRPGSLCGRPVHPKARRRRLPLRLKAIWGEARKETIRDTRTEDGMRVKKRAGYRGSYRDCKNQLKPIELHQNTSLTLISSSHPYY